MKSDDGKVVRRNITFLRKKKPSSLELDVGDADDYKEVEGEKSKKENILENIYKKKEKFNIMTISRR